MSKKEDLRVTRTYKLLCNALVKLLNEKPFKQITVTDICREAMVSRTNFYDHFEDKYHLFTFGIQDMLEEATSTKTGQEDLAGIWLHLLRSVSEMKSFYRRVLLDGDDESLFRIFHDRICQDILDHIRRAHGDVPHTHQIIISEFVTGSIVATLRWWLSTDNVSAEELAEVISGLLAGCARYFDSAEKVKSEE